MKKQEKKDFANYVLRNQSKNKMVFNSRNVPNRLGLIKFFDKIEDEQKELEAAKAEDQPKAAKKNCGCC